MSRLKSLGPNELQPCWSPSQLLYPIWLFSTWLAVKMISHGDVSDALRLAVVQISHGHGFDFAEEAALDGLVAATSLYIQDLGWRSKRCAELAGRAKVDVADVKEALEQSAESVVEPYEADEEELSGPKDVQVRTDQAENTSDHPFGQATKVEAEDGTPGLVSKALAQIARIPSAPRRGAKAAGWVALEKTESPEGPEPCSRSTVQPSTPELSFPLIQCQRPQKVETVVPHPRKKRKSSWVFLAGVGHYTESPPTSEEEQKQEQKSKKSKEEDEDALSELFSGTD
eukprot:s329_g10.t1